MLAFLLALTLVPVTEHTVKLEEGVNPPAATVEEMAWLAGRWTGDGLGGETEETWTPPAGGSMIGMFRLVKEGKPVFYEFISILQTDKGLVMRIKHFHADLIAWEEKDKFVDFLYIGSEGSTYRFAGLTFEREGEDAMTIYLALRQKSGEVREMKFSMKRVNG